MGWQAVEINWSINQWIIYLHLPPQKKQQHKTRQKPHEFYELHKFFWLFYTSASNYCLLSSLQQLEKKMNLF